MKPKLVLFLFMFPFLSNAQVSFQKYFFEKSLRFDFLLGGNSKDVIVYPEQIKQEPFWAGSKTNLLEKFNYGTYRFCVFDLKSDSLLFSKGFSTLFQEWQTTAEAKSTNRSFYQAAIFPYPRNKVKLNIDARQWDGTFKTIYATILDPKNFDS